MPGILVLPRHHASIPCCLLRDTKQIIRRARRIKQAMCSFPSPPISMGSTACIQPDSRPLFLPVFHPDLDIQPVYAEA